MIRRLAPLVAVALLLLAPACGGKTEEAGSASPAGDAATPAEAADPGTVLKEFYRHLNEKDYAGALAHYSGEARKVVEDPDLMGQDAFQAWAYEETKGGTIAEVSVSGAAGGTVDYTLRYQDGSSVTKQVLAVEENGAWKLGMVQ